MPTGDAASPAGSQLKPHRSAPSAVPLFRGPTRCTMNQPPQKSGFSAASVIVPILTGVVGFGAGYLADSFTKAFSGGPAETQAATYNPTAAEERERPEPDDLDRDGIPDEFNGEGDLGPEADPAADEEPADDQSAAPSDDTN